jgi:hypothetical protein
MMQQTKQAWRDKANRLIAEMCRESYEHCNRLPNGRLRKRHVPYAVPMRAAQLVECLKRDDEHGAKSLFMLLNQSPEAARD